MAHIEDAFRFIVPKYRYHSNQAFMVIDNRWQAQDHIEPKMPPCNSLKYPVSGNRSGGRDVVNDFSLLSNTGRSPSAVLNDWTGLPPVPLPYMPPANIGMNANGAAKAPMFWNETPVRGNKCRFMDHCDNISERLAHGRSTRQGLSFVPHVTGDLCNLK